MSLLAALLLAAPACAQLRKITPVPPPSREVYWVNCADEIVIGRFSGVLACDDGKRRHVETLIYQQSDTPEDLLLAQVMLSASAADRMGQNLTARLTDGKEALVVDGELPSKDPGLDNIRVAGVLKRKPPTDTSAQYELKLDLASVPPKEVKGNLELRPKLAKIAVAVLWDGGLKGIGCKGELKKTQNFQVQCGGR